MERPAALRILHIEDDEVDAELIRQTLLRSDLRCDIRLAVSREAYQQALEAGDVDLILSDNRGYDFDGIEVLRGVRRKYPHIPFLFLSGSYEGRDVEKLKAEGAAECLSKFELDALVPAIQRAMHGTQQPVATEIYLRGLERLVTLARDLPLARGPDAVVAMICRAARELVAADAASFVLRDGESCYCAGEDSIAPRWKGQRFPMSDSVSGWAMDNRQTVVIEDMQQDPRVPAAALRVTAMKSLVAVPIEVNNPIGSLSLQWRVRHRPGDAELKLLGMLAEMAAAALGNVRRYADVERQLRESGRHLDAVTRELEAFSYSVSHDLRGPLRSVSGFSKLLAQDYEDQLDQAGKNFLAYVTDGTERVAQLVDALLGLSRVSRAPLKREALDISALAAEVASALKARDPQRRCEVHIQPGLTASADRGMMRIALEQLIGNAWKFTSRRAEARIEVGKLLDNGREAFFVRDNGAGFEMAYADKLFTPFQRQHRQDEFEGVGVGLAAVQRIIARHGGSVWAEAVEGEGATFFFTLEDTASDE